jgi:hypothetical protein
MIMLRYDPVGYVIIEDPTNDQQDLVTCDDLLMDKVVFASMFKLAHDGGGDVTHGEDGYFGRRALFYRGHRGFERHVT